MGRKEGKKRHRSGDIFPMYQGDHEHYGGKRKIKARTAVSEKKNQMARGLWKKSNSVKYVHGLMPRMEYNLIQRVTPSVACCLVMELYIASAFKKIGYKIFY